MLVGEFVDAVVLVLVGEFVDAVVLVLVGEFVGAVVLVLVGEFVGAVVLVVVGESVVASVMAAADVVVVVSVVASVMAAADVVETALVLVVAVGEVPTAVLLVAVGSPGSALPTMVVVVDVLATASSTARSPSDPAHAEAAKQQRHRTANSGPRPSNRIIWRCPPHPERREILHHQNGRDFPRSPRCAPRVWGPSCAGPKECPRNRLVWRSLRS